MGLVRVCPWTSLEAQMADTQKSGSGTLDFFREVTKYFMDFLETDFHKRDLLN